MKSKLLQVTKLLHLLYEWLCCSLCFAFFEVVLLKQDVHYFLLPITGAMFVYSYILREKAQHYLWLFVGHVALRLPMLLLPVREVASDLLLSSRNEGNVRSYSRVQNEYCKRIIH